MPVVDRALSVRKKLFAKYDQLNALWEEAEMQLTKLHIPRPIKAPNYFSKFLDERGGCAECFCLGMQRVKGKWRICHSTYLDQCDPYSPQEWTPILECSAVDRVRAASHIPALRQAIIDDAEAFVPEVEQAIAELTAGLSAIQSPNKPTPAQSGVAK